MVFACSTCKQRARADGSCKNAACADFSENRRRGAHWKLKRLQSALGDVATCFGDFVQGGRVASLAHRHDVRVGIASGMYLRELIPSASLRVEVLSVVFLCYWKWAVASILQSLTRNIEELLGADAVGRASLYERVWEEATLEVRPQEFAVVCNRRDRTVELLPRASVRKLGGGAADYFSCHPMMCPASRRPFQHEFRTLMEDLRSGRLPGATAELAELFAASRANYTTSEVPLRSVRLWASATYSRTRFLRWLFKAEALVAEPCEEDWDLLAGMGSGAERGWRRPGGSRTRKPSLRVAWSQRTCGLPLAPSMDWMTWSASCACRRIWRRLGVESCQSRQPQSPWPVIWE